MWTPEQIRREERFMCLLDLSSWLADACKESRREGLEEDCKKRLFMSRIRICQLLLSQPQTPTEELEQYSVEELRERADDWQELVEVWKKEIFSSCS
jgi:hypothetical protein